MPKLSDSLIADLRRDSRRPGARLNLLNEMLHLSKMENELFRLLNFEGEYQETLDLDIKIGPCQILRAQMGSLEASNFYPARISLWEYDPFNWLLISSEAVNHSAALRAHHKFPKPYGPDETWVIWVHEFRGLVRYEVSGQLSALHSQTPDLYTATQMRDVGLDVSRLKFPRAILKLPRA